MHSHKQINTIIFPFKIEYVFRKHLNHCMGGESSTKQILSSWKPVSVSASLSLLGKMTCTLTIMIRISQGPWLIWVKVSVSSNSWSRKVSMSQESTFSIKRRTVSMETRSKKDHNICLLSVIFNFMVRDLFKGKWSHSLPNVKGLTNGSPRIDLANLGGVVVYTVGMRKKGCFNLQNTFETYQYITTQFQLPTGSFLQKLLRACKVWLLQRKLPTEIPPSSEFYIY